MLFVVGVFVKMCVGLEVSCTETLTKRLSIFKADENHTELYRDVTFKITENECFVDEAIVLEENETLTIAKPKRNVLVTSIVFTTPSTLPKFPSVIFETFPNLTDVHLVFTGIEMLEESDFVNATELKRLRLEQNNIETISETALAKANNLVKLSLPGNHIKKIEDHAFFMLDKMVRLELQQNNLTHLREHVFTGADALREIHLNDNQIEAIEDGAFYLKNLQFIYLQDNRLVTLSHDLLTGTPSLVGIDLSGNSLASIYHVFDKSRNLTTIGLDRNKIETIDVNELANIPSLRILTLASNQIHLLDVDHKNNVSKILPKTNLEYLNLESNSLFSSNIFEQLGIFYRLKFLDLDNNQFKMIENLNNIRKVFPRLIQLSLTNNSLYCQWLDDLTPNVREQNVIIQSIYDNSDESNKLSSDKQRLVDGLPCTEDKSIEETTMDEEIEETTTIRTEVPTE